MQMNDQYSFGGPGGDEDEFMIKKEAPRESNSQRSRKHKKKKYNHTNIFMNSTMAQMGSNREVDPLVNVTNKAGAAAGVPKPHPSQYDHVRPLPSRKREPVNALYNNAIEMLGQSL